MLQVSTLLEPVAGCAYSVCDLPVSFDLLHPWKRAVSRKAAGWLLFSLRLALQAVLIEEGWGSERLPIPSVQPHSLEWSWWAACCENPPLFLLLLRVGAGDRGLCRENKGSVYYSVKWFSVIAPGEKQVEVWDNPWIETKDDIFHRPSYLKDFFPLDISLKSFIGGYRRWPTEKSFLLQRET